MRTTTSASPATPGGAKPVRRWPFCTVIAEAGRPSIVTTVPSTKSVPKPVSVKNVPPATEPPGGSIAIASKVNALARSAPTAPPRRISIVASPGSPGGVRISKRRESMNVWPSTRRPPIHTSSDSRKPWPRMIARVLPRNGP